VKRHNAAHDDVQNRPSFSGLKILNSASPFLILDLPIFQDFPEEWQDIHWELSLSDVQTAEH
jgi:hypothetical protein